MLFGQFQNGHSKANLQIGESFTIEQLLNVLLVASGNDAANVLAEHVGGSIDIFANMMNEKATEIGCKNTNFTNPSGMHNENHYSTAYDLALIGQYAMKNKTFADTVRKTSCSLPSTNFYNSNDRVFNTTNELLRESSSNYYKYAIGIKTGFTTPAGNCLVSESSKDGLNLICVVLGGFKNTQGIDTRFQDTIKLFNFGYENFLNTTIIQGNSIIDTIEINGATPDTKFLNLIIENDINAFINKQTLNKTLTPTITLYDNLSAPILAGNIVGRVSYNIEGNVYDANLIAGNNVEKDYTMYKVLLLVGLLLIIIALVVLIWGCRRKKDVDYYDF